MTSHWSVGMERSAQLKASVAHFLTVFSLCYGGREFCISQNIGAQEQFKFCGYSKL